MRSELDLQIDGYLRDPADFPAEFMWWIRRLIEDTAGPTDVDAAAAGGGGIDFNKTNDQDATGADAQYLYVKLIGSTPYSDGTTNWALFAENTGVPGGMGFLQDGDGFIGFFANGAGSPSHLAGTSDYGGANHDSYPTATRSDGVVLNNNGDGIMLLRNTASTTVIDNSFGGIMLTGGGTDFNSVALKFLTQGFDFLIASDQTVTRNAGTHHITAITMSHQAFRVTPGATTGLWMYSLPTSASGLTTGQVWNSSGVLHIV